MMVLRDRPGHLESPLLAKQALRAFRVQLEIRDHLVRVRQALLEPPGLRGRLGLQVLQVQQGQVEPLVIQALPGARGRQVPAVLLGVLAKRGLRENKDRQALLVWLVRQERQARQVNWGKPGQQEQERQVQLELQARPGHKVMKELQVRLDLLEYKEPQVKLVLRELRVQPDQRDLRATLATMALRDRREIKALREQLARQA